MELFSQQHVAGVFRGFREGGMEFHADLALPYRSDFQSIPMHGQFLLVQLETPEEAVLGRICSFSSEGKLSSGSGEEFNIRAVRERRPIPDDLREDYLKYRVNIRVLGVLRANGSNRLIFVASHRRLPHVGSAVAFPSGEVLREICGHNLDGAAIGHFALGEYIYANRSAVAQREAWMQVKEPEVIARFPVESLVSRRSFIFARAGFGKSNLNKLLFSKLYEGEPSVEKRGGHKVPVGTIIFDPDGEYFWPDDKGRPGLCDVEHLEDKLVVFTSRAAPSAFYGSFVAGGIKLDIRQLKPADVISIALPPERQDQQNVAKLRGLSPEQWRQLVDLVDRDRNTTDLNEIAGLMRLDLPRQDAEAVAARSNVSNIIAMLHDKGSQLMGLLLRALRDGKICVVDLSQMRGQQGFVLAGIILRRIFDHNQAGFTKAEPDTIPTIAVIEEAQSVLSDRATAAEPYVAWVKEGRKYDLGALLVTQQPGSIPNDILSQGDNWFIFHLLSAGDLGNVKKANAHFSDDLLSSLLNEPIPGQGVFWSSVGGKSYPVPVRVLSFEQSYTVRDPDNTKAEIAIYAGRLRSQSQKRREEARTASLRSEVGGTASPAAEAPDDDVDMEALYRNQAIIAVRESGQLLGYTRGIGAFWAAVREAIETALPQELDDRNGKANSLVPFVMNEIFGKQPGGWHTFKDEKNRRRIKAGPPPQR